MTASVAQPRPPRSPLTHLESRHRMRARGAVLVEMASHRYVPLKQVHEHQGYEWATERLLRRLVHERRIPYSKPAKGVLIDLNDLDAMVEHSRVEPVHT